MPSLVKSFLPACEMYVMPLGRPAPILNFHANSAEALSKKEEERFSLSESFMPDMSLNELQQQYTFFGRVKVGKPAAEAQQRGCDHNPVQFEID